MREPYLLSSDSRVGLMVLAVLLLVAVLLTIALALGWQGFPGAA